MMACVHISICLHAVYGHAGLPTLLLTNIHFILANRACPSENS